MALAVEDVRKVPVNSSTSLYSLGDMTFDEADRSFDYIDRQIETWRAWREWVEKNGEMK